jgi:hypothetical protein
MKSFLINLSCFVFVFFSNCATTDTTVDNNSHNGTIAVQSSEKSSASTPPDIEESNYDTEMINRTIKQANFEFYNALLYRDQSAWTGRTVGVLGMYPGNRPSVRVYTRNENEFYFAGSYNGRPIGIVAMLDHPLPMSRIFDKAVPLISPLQEILVFGSIRGLENLMDDNGYSCAMPVIECLLIYDKDDYSFRKPLWVSSKFEKLPEGTVTVDSLKYEFDKRK